MKEQERTDLLFQALSDATRRDIVSRTMAHDHSVTGLAGFYDMSFAAVQKHVAVLERAGLVTKIPHGRERMVRGNHETILLAQRKLDELEKIWSDRVDRMREILKEPEKGKRK